MLQDMKTTLAVDGMPKCDVHTAAAALEAARRLNIENPGAKITVYQWNNTHWYYDAATDSIEEA